MPAAKVLDIDCCCLPVSSCWPDAPCLVASTMTSASAAAWRAAAASALSVLPELALHMLLNCYINNIP